MSDWTTRVDPTLTRSYGVQEQHCAGFEPPGWPGKGNTVLLGIPECEFQVCALDADDEPFVTINQPQQNKNVKFWTKSACEWAAKDNAFLMLSCDTAEQVEVAAKRVAKALPHYRRVALERMYEPENRLRGALS
jgi:hypothetical protein